MGATPPTLARLLLHLSTTPSEREFLLGDLEEEFLERCGADQRRARSWYWGQALRSLHQLLGLRLATAFSEHLRLASVPSAHGRLMDDLRYAARALRRAPGFCALAVATIALGIGSITSIFAFVDHVLLRPLPFDEPERVVVLEHYYLNGRAGRWNPSFPDYIDYSEQSASFETLAAWRALLPRTLDDSGEAIRVRAAGVTAGFFPTLRLRTRIGRLLLVEDEEGGQPKTALISESFWRSRFAGDSGVLGTELPIDSDVYTIVGVIPDLGGVRTEAHLPHADTQVWLPYRNSLAAEGMSARGLANVSVLGRLAPGVTAEQASAEIDALAARLVEQFPDMKAGEGARLVPALTAITGSVRRTLLVLLGAVSFVLLLVCSNVAGLLIGRFPARTRELAIRAAVGGHRARIVRQLLSESVILGLVGGLLGWLFAVACVRGVVALSPAGVPRLEQVAIDYRVLLFLLAVSTVSGLVIGFVPAIQATSSLTSALNAGGARSGARSSVRTRRLLVVGEVAVATLLVFGAALLLRSFQRELRVEPGFNEQNVLLAKVQLPMPFVSPEWPRAVSFFEQLNERVGALPGVRATAIAYQHPMSPGWSNSFLLPDRAESDPDHKASAIFRPVGPGYFRVAGISLLEGRVFSARDDSSAPGVVIVNRAFVKRYFPDGEALGKRVEYGDFWHARPPEYEIVGVIADVHSEGPSAPPKPATYFPHAQQPVREMTLLIRTEGDPLALAPEVRSVLGALDPTLPLDEITTLDRELQASLAPALFVTSLLTGFATLALTLAVVGVYGLLTALVAQRRHEIGIRIALGAAPGRIRRSVLGEGLTLSGLGLALGLLGALGLSRLVAHLLFDTSSKDPVTLLVVAMAIGGSALVASYVPSRRAVRLDPYTALRGD